VYRTEVMALLTDVPGVASVTGVALLSGGEAQGRCDNVELCPHELVMAGSLRLAIVSEIGRNLKRSDAHECESV
jgi:hypothetical protein